MTNERYTLEGLAKNISPEQMLRLLQQGNVKTGRTYSSEERSAFLSALAPVIKEAPTETPFVGEREGVHLLRIFNPAANMYYVTLIVDGVPLFTRNAEGKLDQNLLYDSEEPLLRKIVEAGMPEDVQTFFKNGAYQDPDKTKENKKKTKAKHRLKDKPRYVFDPHIETFLQKCGEALVFEALENNPLGEVKETISGQDLEQLLDAKLLREIHSQGFHVSLQSVTNYVACSRRKIRDLRRIYVNDFLATDAVTTLVSTYLRTFEKELSALLNRSKNEELVFVDAKKIYFWFTQQNPEVSVQHAVDGLRSTLFNLYADRMGKEDYLRFRDATAKWLAYAKAADYVKKDKYLQTEIVPLFRESEPKDKKIRARDINFEVVCRLGKRIVADDKHYLPLYLRMTVRGLWIFNCFEKDQDSQENSSRSAYGVDVEYVQPLVHYLERKTTYDPLLFAAGEKIRREGTAFESFDLETAADCEALGRELYNALPQQRREKMFTDRRKGYEGRPLVADGTHLGRILRMHVGIHRERYQQKKQTNQ